MHEVGLMQDTLDIVFDRAYKADASLIRTIRLRVGEDSGVAPSSLRFAFSALVQDTIAQDATLELQSVPVSCYCHACSLEFAPGDIFYECPACHKLSTDIRSGREFELVSVEVD